MIHLYCGDGKGKSTAAAGLALRMAGRGKQVVFARFLKSDDSGEVPVLRNIEGIELIPCDRTFGFTWQMDENTKKEAALYYRKTFSRACGMALDKLKELGNVSAPACMAVGDGNSTGKAGSEPEVLLVLDEICGAVNGGFLPESSVLEFLMGCPEGLEVVLTGRNPSEKLLSAADYVTEMRALRHPYERGIGAREGVEY